MAAGDTLFAERKFSEAAIEYRRAVQASPQLGAAHYKLAESYETLRQPLMAYREYIYAADLLPDDVHAQVKAADYLLSAGRYEDARTRAESALAGDPVNVDAQIIKGNPTVGLKNLDGAIADMNEAIAIAPGDPRSYAAIGVIQMYQGKAPEAEATFTRALAVELAQGAQQQVPASPQIADTLGWTYLKKDLPVLAIPQFEESVRRAPTNAEYFFHLGLAQSKAGNKAKALDALSTALKLKPGVRAAEAARGAL